MVRVLALIGTILAVSVAVASSKRPVKADPGKIIPKGTSVVFVLAGKAGPGEKGWTPHATINDFGSETTLTDDPFDVWLTPKAGKAIKVAENWKPKDEPTTIDLPALVGIITVRGDDLPRADSVVVTPLKDPGPDEKGHVAIQVASDYKEDMLVPVGTYEVWVKPANGARPQRIVDYIRVQNGRLTEVPER